MKKTVIFLMLLSLMSVQAVDSAVFDLDHIGTEQPLNHFDSRSDDAAPNGDAHINFHLLHHLSSGTALAGIAAPISGNTHPWVSAEPANGLEHGPPVPPPSI